MAYSYQQNVYEGASYGYVQYNISPDIGTPISAGTTVTITGNNYTITFTIGDAYDKAVFSVLIARSFANMHLSGVPTGGVAFGKFSSAQPDQPLFECAYPIVLVGSAVYGSSSAMPSNPVEGQLYFVVE